MDNVIAVINTGELKACTHQQRVTALIESYNALFRLLIRAPRTLRSFNTHIIHDGKTYHLTCTFCHIDDMDGYAIAARDEEFELFHKILIALVLTSDRSRTFCTNQDGSIMVLGFYVLRTP